VVSTKLNISLVQIFAIFAKSEKSEDRTLNLQNIYIAWLLLSHVIKIIDLTNTYLLFLILKEIF